MNPITLMLFVLSHQHSWAYVTEYEEKDSLVESIRKQNIVFQTSEPDILLAQITEAVTKAGLDLKEKNRLGFWETRKRSQRLEECVTLLNRMKTFKNSSNEFNGQDPIAMTTLMMLQNSPFEYFWIDVLCAPQGQTDKDLTLRVR